MSDIKKASLILTPGSGPRNRVVIGGHDLTNAVCALDLVIFEAEVDGEMTVHVPDKTRAALVTLGWTPPEGD